MKTASMLWGYGPFGPPRFCQVTLQDNEQLCTQCDGSGTVVYDDGVDGFSRLSKGRCDDCGGEGTTTIEIMEDE